MTPIIFRCIEITTLKDRVPKNITNLVLGKKRSIDHLYNIINTHNDVSHVNIQF